MSSKSMKEIQKLSADELKSKSASLEKEIFEARMKKATGTLENLSVIWKLRKELARVRGRLTSVGTSKN